MTHRDPKIESIVRDLTERAKELNCLYAVEEAISAAHASFESICERVIAAIPPGWQYSEACRVRISIQGATYASPEFTPTPWAQCATIRVQGEPAGTIE